MKKCAEGAKSQILSPARLPFRHVPDPYYGPLKKYFSCRLTLCHCNAIQRPGTPGTPGAPSATHVRKRPSHSGTYQKVLDSRKRPVRGLGIRNGRYYARVAVPELGPGVT